MRYALCLFVLLSLGAFAADYPKPLEIGSSAPPFDLPGVDGKNHTLEEYKDAKLLALVFTCNHCPTAQAYEERLMALHADYKDRDVAVVVISPNDPLALRLDELGYTDVGDTLEDMITRKNQKGFEYPYLYDGETQEASRAYGPQSTPHAFVFDQDRKLRYRGRIDDSERIDRVKTHDLRNAIDALLADNQVPVETTKTMGCSTKWSDKRQSVVDSLEKWAREDVTLEPIDTAAVTALVKNDTKNLRVINVWATWCVPCRVEFPDLVTIKRMYSTREFELITINVDSPKESEKVLEFLKENESSGASYQFASEDVYPLVDALDPKWEGQLPYTLVVAPGGEILSRIPGAFDPLELRRTIVGYLGRIYK